MKKPVAQFKSVSIQTEAGVELATVKAGTGPSVITIKRLGWRRLKEADTANTKAAIAHVRDLGGAAVIKEIREAGGREAIETASKKDPLLSYDQDVLITIGITAVDGQPCTKEISDEFEPETVEATARAVLKLSRPALFEEEEDRKND